MRGMLVRLLILAVLVLAVLATLVLWGTCNGWGRRQVGTVGTTPAPIVTGAYERDETDWGLVPYLHTSSQREMTRGTGSMTWQWKPVPLLLTAVLSVCIWAPVAYVLRRWSRVA